VRATPRKDGRALALNVAATAAWHPARRRTTRIRRRPRRRLSRSRTVATGSFDQAIDQRVEMPGAFLVSLRPSQRANGLRRPSGTFEKDRIARAIVAMVSKLR
jgi:hypothetical protein